MYQTNHHHHRHLFSSFELHAPLFPLFPPCLLRSNFSTPLSPCSDQVPFLTYFHTRVSMYRTRTRPSSQVPPHCLLLLTTTNSTSNPQPSSHSIVKTSLASNISLFLLLLINTYSPIYHCSFGFFYYNSIIYFSLYFFSPRIFLFYFTFFFFFTSPLFGRCYVFVFCHYIRACPSSHNHSIGSSSPLPLSPSLPLSFSFSFSIPPQQTPFQPLQGFLFSFLFILICSSLHIHIFHFLNATHIGLRFLNLSAI